MFQKIIKNIKNFFSTLDDEEKFMLGSSIGLVFLGFLIYLTWQTRLTDPVPEPVETEEIEENENEEEEEEVILENEQHGYQIVDIANQVEEKEEAEIFGLKEPSDFAVEYNGVSHAVFKNEQDLSIDQWIRKKIDEKGPTGESEEEQKSFLNIVLVRKIETKLGPGREVVRMNGYQSGELFIPWNNYILSFYYRVENVREVSNMENIREEFINSIEE